MWKSEFLGLLYFDDTMVLLFGMFILNERIQWLNPQWHIRKQNFIIAKSNPKNDSSPLKEANHPPPFRFFDAGSCPSTPANSVKASLSGSTSRGLVRAANPDEILERRLPSEDGEAVTPKNEFFDFCWFTYSSRSVMLKSNWVSIRLLLTLRFLSELNTTYKAATSRIFVQFMRKPTFWRT